MSKKSDVIQAQAEEIANNASNIVGGNKVGFTQILIPIIAAVLPTLIDLFKNCTKSNPVASTPQKFVQHRYDDSTEIYDSKLLRLTRDEVRKEAKKQGQKLTKDQAEIVAIKTLDQARLAENNVVGTCFRK